MRWAAKRIDGSGVATFQGSTSVRFSMAGRADPRGLPIM